MHKFRSTIGKSKLVRPGDHVLLACSGGVNSMAMVDMIKKGLVQDDVHRRIRFVPSILFIDGKLLFICCMMINFCFRNDFE